MTMAWNVKQDYRQTADRFRNYDATEAAGKTAQAQWNLIQTPLAEGIEDLRGQHVAQGRFDTGFRFDNEDRLVRDIYDRFTNQMAANSLQAQGLNLSAWGTGGEMQAAEMERRYRKQQDDRKRKGGFGGLLGGLAGGVIGSFVPGVGTALGSYLGGQLGNAAGQWI